MKNAAEPLVAASTHGSRIVLADGRKLVDGVASWWTACHGYNHPHIIAAMQEQLQRLPHVMFGGICHDQATRLAARLADIAPGDLTRVFFSDSGSVAIEVALKMAVQFWLNMGERRTQFLHFRHGYHGDTMACMSICDPDEGMHTLFGNYLPQNILADLPRDEATAARFEEMLWKNKNRVAAVVVEPLVQGVGGMRFHDASCLRFIAECCTRHNVLVIADEIFTGFGRTGTMFACEQAGVVPDIMCIGKALTGGAVTLAATLARQYVFDAFWSDNETHALMHGPTYMANPLACAAANASLDLFEIERNKFPDPWGGVRADKTETYHNPDAASSPSLQSAKGAPHRHGAVLGYVQDLEKALREGLAPSCALPRVVDVRAIGGIGVVQITGSINHRVLRQRFIDHGVWVRSWGDCIYLTPPLNIAADDLARLTSAVCEVVRENISSSS